MFHYVICCIIICHVEYTNEKKVEYNLEEKIGGEIFFENYLKIKK